MKQSHQLEFGFDKSRAHSRPGIWRMNVHVVSRQIRNHTYDYVREHQRPYDPRAMKAAILQKLRNAGTSYVPFLELCDHLEEFGDVVLVSRMLHWIELWGYIEKKPKYYCTDDLLPDEPPVPYRGFQFQYRLKQSAGS